MRKKLLYSNEIVEIFTLLKSAFCTKLLMKTDIIVGNYDTTSLRNNIEGVSHGYIKHSPLYRRSNPNRYRSTKEAWRSIINFIELTAMVTIAAVKCGNSFLLSGAMQ